MSQLVHVASCNWWRGDGRSMWGHPSTNHNSPHERVVALELLPDIWVTWAIKLEVKVKVSVDSIRTKLFESDCLI